MAKDGTARGGQRSGSGRKSKALKEKMDAGNPGGRKLKVVDLPKPSEIDAEDIPEPSDYLKATQKTGSSFNAEGIYKEVWMWIKERGCDRLVSRQLVEQYAMSVSRLIQCEDAISEYGFIAKHPTTNAPCTSPFVTMAQSYQKQVTSLWYQIFQVVKENCSSDFNPEEEDPMELLLRSRR